jgi:3D (Asp-Asp-Asp) domain-containing protein
MAAGVSLWFLLGSAREAERSAPGLALGQRFELDGNANLDGDDEAVSIAALNGEPQPQAVPVVLHEDGLSVSTVSTATTVSELLSEKGAVIEHADYLSPSAGSLVTAGTHVYIEHARELSLSIGGDATTIHSRKANVAAVLDEAGVSLNTLDRVEPALDAPVQDGLAISVVRVWEESETVDEAIPCAVVYQDDPTMDMGQSVVLDPGTDGLIQREYHVVYEDGQEMQRELVSESQQQPRDQVIAQGTRPVNLVQAPDGPLRYSRSLEMYATWYNPASCGWSTASPWYGIAATGVPVQRGIVAVDPSVIPLGTRLYIPGYGQAIAADTGSAVIGNIIDLGFADHEVPDWRSGWVTVYVLE